MKIYSSEHLVENPHYLMSRRTRGIRTNSSLGRLINKSVPILAFAGIGYMAGGMDGSLTSILDAAQDGFFEAARSGIAIPSVMMSPAFVVPSAIGAAVKINDASQFAMRCWENVMYEIRDLLARWVEKRRHSNPIDSPDSSNLWLEDLSHAGVVIVPKNAALNAIDQLLIAHDSSCVTGGTDETQIVICDRKNLGLARAALRKMARKQIVRSSVSLFNDGNCGDPETTPPALLQKNRDGSVHAVWANEKGYPFLATSYGKDGYPEQSIRIGDDGYHIVQSVTLPNLAQVTARMDMSIDRMEKEVEAILENTKYYADTHYVKPLKDGSYVVLDKRSDRVDNPYGPAVVTTNGRELYYRQGKNIMTGPWKNITPSREERMESINEFREFSL